MLNQKKFFLLMFGLAISLGMAGCAEKRIESSEVPKQPGMEGTSTRASELAAGHYFVQRHDCLWTIAGQSKVYGDSFQWPELFKANRDQIKDPDLIYPRQDLRVERGFSIEETNHARQMAMATPKYVPHSKPRETLPVDYF
jgi:hypothetical protein